MTADPVTFAAVYRELTGPTGPGPAVVRAAFDAILAGSWTPAQVAGFVIALRMQGETASVVASAVEAMRAAMIAVDHGLEATLDTCGTGGDGLHTLNVSTAAAIVVASLGVVVAKHGNRAASSRAGTADVLEALGLPIDLAPERHGEVLREAGITFLFAPTHHPAMRHAAAVRRELGVPTIFNILGPLANPARATHQLVGTFDDRFRPLMAETLRALGTRRAWIVRGEDGLDEVSPTAPTRVTELDGGVVRERIVTPADFGLRPSPPGALAGSDAASNARAIEAILRGEAHPARDAVVMNAGAALTVARGVDPKEGAVEAARALRNGLAHAALERWRAAARRAGAR
jgi:anthranilate phosphoribosyltransferase